MMPVWLQVFYIVLSAVVLTTAGWVTRTVVRQGNKIAGLEVEVAKINQRCSERRVDINKLFDGINRIDRNIVLLGAKNGLDLDHKE